MKISEWLKNEKNIKILAAIALFLIAMIFLSSVLKPSGGQEESKPEAKDDSAVIFDYCSQYESRVLQIVNCIDGVGEARVMVTLEGGLEYVYAKEEKQKNDITDRNGETKDEHNSSEKTTILIEDENGNKKALIKTVKEPQVKGVVVVCEGGDDIKVKLQVTDALKAALDIGAGDVCVTKLKNNI